MRITLTVAEGPHKDRVFAFAGHDVFLVGRSKQAHFRLASKDKFFSRLHFLVEVSPPHCRLLDLGSRNGTHVNGQKVKTADLKDGDKVRAGHTLLLVSVDSTPLPPQPAPAAPPLAVSDLPTVPPVRRAALPPTAPRPVPPEAAGRSKSPPPLPSTIAVRCPLCAVASSEPPGPVASKPGPLCATCLAEIGGQAQLIAGYQIVRELGKGGMGVVSLALRSADGTAVALKTIIPALAGTDDQVARFLREAGALRELSHPNIVAFRDMGESNGRLYFAMEYVRGIDASRLVRNHGPLPIGRAVGLVCQLLEALEHAHGQGFVHRDIKPSNLMVTQVGNREVVKLADFGLARVYQASGLSGLTVTGDMGGTPGFMPPEQITHFRAALPPVDQFATAATLCILLTNRLIYDFPQQLHERVLLILHEDPVAIQLRRADVPAELARIIHRGLAREPSARFADAREMRQALLRFRA